VLIPAVPVLIPVVPGSCPDPVLIPAVPVLIPVDSGTCAAQAVLIPSVSWYGYGQLHRDVGILFGFCADPRGPCTDPRSLCLVFFLLPDLYYIYLTT